MKFKKTIFFMLAIIMTFSITTPALAAANENNAVIPQEAGFVDILTPDVMTRGNGFPTKSWNLSNGPYAGSFTSLRSHVYTNYHFRANSSGQIKVNFSTWWHRHPSVGFNPKLYVALVKKGGTVVSTRTYNSVSQSNINITFSSLSKTTDYAVYFHLSQTSSYDSIAGSFTVKH